MSTEWDDRAFQTALRSRLNKLEQSADALPKRMTDAMAERARSTVARDTGGTAAGIKSTGGKGEAEFRAPNPYLEFGTSRMSAQPFVRPARNEVEQAFRAGRYKPDL